MIEAKRGRAWEEKKYKEVERKKREKEEEGGESSCAALRSVSLDEGLNVYLSVSSLKSSIRLYVHVPELGIYFYLCLHCM